MRTVVFELNKKHAVMLTAEGEFIRVKNAGYAIGQDVSLPASIVFFKRNFRNIILCTAAAGFAVAVGIVVSVLLFSYW